VLANLAFVVVDEAHVYRGVFGSHVANVLRRLRRLARRYGTEPRFMLTSATIANPVDLAER
jgi:DEAD/DEAH box helicase domain-containing protein